MALDPNTNGWPKTPGLEKAASDLSRSLQAQERRSIPSVPRLLEVTDSRITDLLDTVRVTDDGFANNMIWKGELASLLIEVQRSRNKPLHCPGCDGDHL